MEVGVSAIGAFPSGSSGDGVHQGASYSAGVLASYRHLFTAHQGAEVDYGYTRDTGQDSALSGPAGVLSDVHEFSVSYVYRISLGRLNVSCEFSRPVPRLGIQSAGLRNRDWFQCGDEHVGAASHATIGADRFCATDAGSPHG